MISFSLVTNNFIDRSCDAYVFFLRHQFDMARLSALAKPLAPLFESSLKERGFTGRAGNTLIINSVYNNRAIYLIFIGLGDLPDERAGGYGSIEPYRRALGSLVRIAESHRLNSFTFELPDPVLMNLSYEHLAQETSTILDKASYHFDQFITNDDRKYQWDMNAFIGVNKKFEAETQKGLDLGRSFAEAINTARRWCDMPPSLLPPDILAEEAVKLAKEHNLSTKVFTKKDILAFGMGGIEGVARGSVHEPRLVVIEYYPQEKSSQTVVLVGKGVTFDTGGLCLKPPSGMLTMKDDMAGAAVVMAAMNVIAQLQPSINVIALAPLVENMPSGSAHKPGDVIIAYNGKTIELIDTDAEGRLILADALSYANEIYKPSAMFDVATLTGACAHALGVYYAGLFTQHEELAQRTLASSYKTGDHVWRMPLDDDYRPALYSDIADMKNIGSPKYLGSAITASLFLKEFTGNTPWVHLDIAGVAFGVPDLTYVRPGATGFGIRLLTDLVMTWQPLTK